jgi:hypothetical protein
LVKSNVCKEIVGWRKIITNIYRVVGWVNTIVYLPLKGKQTTSKQLVVFLTVYQITWFVTSLEIGSLNNWMGLAIVPAIVK